MCSKILDPKSGAGIPEIWGRTSRIWGRTSANLGLHFRSDVVLSTGLRLNFRVARGGGFLRKIGAAVPTRAFSAGWASKRMPSGRCKGEWPLNLGPVFRFLCCKYKHLAEKGPAPDGLEATALGANLGPDFQSVCRDCGDLAVLIDER